jgi:hypothetical protein
MHEYLYAQRGHALPCPRGVDALRQAMRAYVRGGTHHDVWRGAVRLMCEDARTRGVQVEELLISLKRTWAISAGVEGIPRQESCELLARVVTLCVAEYYAPLG